VHTYLASRPLEHPMYVCVCAWGEKAKPIYSIYFTRAPACHPSDLPHISTYFTLVRKTGPPTKRGLMRLGKPTPPRIQTRDCLTLIYDPTLQMYTAPFPTTGLLAQSMHPTPPLCFCVCFCITAGTIVKRPSLHFCRSVPTPYSRTLCS